MSEHVIPATPGTIAVCFDYKDDSINALTFDVVGWVFHEEADKNRQAEPIGSFLHDASLGRISMNDCDLVSIPSPRNNKDVISEISEWCQDEANRNRKPVELRLHFGIKSRTFQPD